MSDSQYTPKDPPGKISLSEMHMRQWRYWQHVALTSPDSAIRMFAQNKAAESMFNAAKFETLESDSEGGGV